MPNFRKLSILTITTTAVLILTGCNSDSGGATDNSESSNGTGSNDHTTADIRSWTLLDPNQTQAYPLNDVFHADETTVWAIGEGLPESLGGLGPYILKSTDSGDTWSQYKSEFSKNLLGIHFTDNDHGWIVGGLSFGEPPIILRTEDGGDNWAEQNHPITETGTFYDIEFVNATHGWIAGGNNGSTVDTSERYILNTTDGGESWQEVAYDFGNGLPFLSISFVDTQHGWAVGRDTEDDNNDSYYYTTDGGTNWQSAKTDVYQEADIYSNRFELVQFIDTDLGYLSGTTRVMKTTNGGLTWDVIFQSGDVSIRDMHFVDNQTGWLVGNGIGLNNSVAKIFFTEDGGNLWHEETITNLPSGSNADTALKGIHAYDTDNVIAVGNRTTIIQRESN
jgi:photosystem II stability/assembly factor-like uncharacterized protein